MSKTRPPRGLRIILFILLTHQQREVVTMSLKENHFFSKTNLDFCFHMHLKIAETLRFCGLSGLSSMGGWGEIPPHPIQGLLVVIPTKSQIRGVFGHQCNPGPILHHFYVKNIFLPKN